MVKKCVLKGCPNQGVVSDVIHYHGLPRNEATRQLWIQWICNENKTESVPKAVFLCSNHFRPEDRGSRKLRARSVPSIGVSCNEGGRQLCGENVQAELVPLFESNESNEYTSVIEIICGANEYRTLLVSDSSGVGEIDYSSVSEITVGTNEVSENCDYFSVIKLPVDSTAIHEYETVCIASNDQHNVEYSNEDRDIAQALPPTDSKDNENQGKESKDCSSVTEIICDENGYRTLFVSVLSGVEDVEYSSVSEITVGTNEASENRDYHPVNMLPVEYIIEDRDRDREDSSETLLVTKDNENECSDTAEKSKPDKYQQKFEHEMHNLEWRTCNKCSERFICKKSSKAKCRHTRNTCKNFSVDNNMDPGEVPSELQGLSRIEELLIARIHPVVSVFKLKRGHQLGCRGNVICFPQKIKELAKQLPHPVTDLKSVLVLKTRDELNPVEFQVRGDKVRQALEWLIKNNSLYTDVILSQDNIDLLPVDGNVYDLMTSFFIPARSEESSDCDEENEDEMDVDSEEGNFRNSSLCESFIPAVGNISEQSQITYALWPDISNQPVDEFNTAGYIALCFPVLFAYGRADLRSPHNIEVSPTNYFKHLLLYKDQRFARHPVFRFFAMNCLMRWAARKDGGIFVNRSSKFKNMTVAQLKEELEKNPSFIKKVMFQSSNIRGTRAYWYARGKELVDMVEQTGLPTLFYTLSAADLHWPDLFKILLSEEEDLSTLTDADRWRLIEENPFVADYFFLERCEVFITEVLKKKYDVIDLWFRIEYQHRGSPHLHGLLWLHGAPDVRNILNCSEEEKERILKGVANPSVLLTKVCNYLGMYHSTAAPIGPRASTRAEQ